MRDRSACACFDRRGREHALIGLLVPSPSWIASRASSQNAQADVRDQDATYVLPCHYPNVGAPLPKHACPTLSPSVGLGSLISRLCDRWASSYLRSCTNCYSRAQCVQTGAYRVRVAMEESIDGAALHRYTGSRATVGYTLRDVSVTALLLSRSTTTYQKPFGDLRQYRNLPT